MAPLAPQPPTAPSNAQDLAASYNRIDVYWQDNSSNETGFEVYRGDGMGAVFTRITTTASGATYFADTGLNSSAQYCHKIRAFTTSGGVTAFSAFSNITCTTTPAPPEPPVVQLTAVTTGTDIDPDGYNVDLWQKCYWSSDCRYYFTRGSVAANGSVSFRNYNPADYVMEVSGIAANCDFTTANPINVTMTATASAVGSIGVTCRPGNFRPVWSPDGSKIAFTSDRDGNNEIYVMNADGSGLVNLTNHLADDGDPAWSPDGKKIAFRSNRDDSQSPSVIYVMNADGSAVTLLPTSGTEVAQLAWSPDGTLIAYSAVWCSYSCLRLILVVSVVDRSIQYLTTPFQTSVVEGMLQWPSMECESHSEPAWYPEGRKLTYTIAGECFGGRSVMFWRLDGPQQYEGQGARWLFELITFGFNSSWRP